MFEGKGTGGGKQWAFSGLISKQKTKVSQYISDALQPGITSGEAAKVAWSIVDALIEAQENDGDMDQTFLSLYPEEPVAIATGTNGRYNDEIKKDGNWESLFSVE